jgi:hypothetical protein
MPAYLLIILASLGIVSAIVTLLAIHTAEVGYEDATGFHFGATPPLDIRAVNRSSGRNMQRERMYPAPEAIDTGRRQLLRGSG